MLQYPIRRLKPTLHFYPLEEKGETVQPLIMNEILDLSDPHTFAAGHLPGALNLPYGPAFFPWARMFLDPAEQRTLIIPTSVDLEIFSQNLKAFDPNCTYIYKKSSDLSAESLVPLKLIDAANVNVKTHTVVDVRGPEEWRQKFLEGAIALELSKLKSEYATLPKNRPLAVICASGTRSSIAASFLINCGFTDVASVRGGMNAIRST